jgi:hypothetical protein
MVSIDLILSNLYDNFIVMDLYPHVLLTCFTNRFHRYPDFITLRFYKS